MSGHWATRELRALNRAVWFVERARTTKICTNLVKVKKAKTANLYILLWFVKGLPTTGRFVPSKLVFWQSMASPDLR